ncbi:MAG: carbon storage regulator CsrA [Isosphaeraceae bacterium]
MLVLSRRANEKILIGDEIVVSVVRVEGNQVRLGISAPRDVRVLRSEIAPHDNTGRPRTWNGPDAWVG